MLFMKLYSLGAARRRDELSCRIIPNNRMAGGTACPAAPAEVLPFRIARRGGDQAGVLANMATVIPEQRFDQDEGFGVRPGGLDRKICSRSLGTEVWALGMFDFRNHDEGDPWMVCAADPGQLLSVPEPPISARRRTGWMGADL